MTDGGSSCRPLDVDSLCKGSSLESVVCNSVSLPRQHALPPWTLNSSLTFAYHLPLFYC